MNKGAGSIVIVRKDEEGQDMFLVGLRKWSYKIRDAWVFGHEIDAEKCVSDMFVQDEVVSAAVDKYGTAEETRPYEILARCRDCGVDMDYDESLHTVEVRGIVKGQMKLVDRYFMCDECERRETLAFEEHTNNDD